MATTDLELQNLSNGDQQKEEQISISEEENQDSVDEVEITLSDEEIEQLTLE